MKARDIIDDEWADKTVPDHDALFRDSLVHDSLVPHALASEDLENSSAQVSPPRPWMGPLVAIGSVLAMACALPVIGWAAHRPASANGGEDDAPTVQAAASPTPIPVAANGGATPPSAAADALGASPNGLASVNGHALASDKARKKRTPSKRGSDRVAGLASAVAGLASAAAQPPAGSVEPSSTAPMEESRSPKQTSAHAQMHAPAPTKSVEDQAAAELSSALK